MTPQPSDLLDVERRIALFAQAITGTAYEVRAADTFAGDEVVVRHGPSDAELEIAVFAGEHRTSLTMRQSNRRAYRLLSLHQLGYREFGTFEFRLADAAQHSATCPSRIGDPEIVARIRPRRILRDSRCRRSRVRCFT